MNGRIICIISNRYTVLLEDGREVVAIAMGKLRLGQSPVVGDMVKVVQYDDQFGIEQIFERRNELIRPLIANIDQALIVMSAKDPVFSTTLVDRLIFLIGAQNIRPVIIVTKMDMVNDGDELYAWVEDYQKSGYEVLLTSKFDDNLSALEALLANKVSVLTGQSGVGKSSLLNALNKDFTIRTQETSKALGRGKHTTRHVELMQVGQGWVADTPGFSSLDFSVLSKQELQNAVPDFAGHREHCKFNDCIHDKEPGCEVKKGVEEGKISSLRYEHYLECLALCKGKDDYS